MDESDENGKNRVAIASGANKSHEICEGKLLLAEEF